MSYRKIRLIDGDGEAVLPGELASAGPRTSGKVPLNFPRETLASRREPNRSAFAELRHVTVQDVPLGSIEDRFFAPESERVVADVVTARLDEQFPGRRFFLKKELVREVMASVFATSRPTEVGAINTRGTVPLRGQNYLFELLDKTTNAIITSVAVEQDMIHNNEKLSAWDTVLGESNRQGLRAHAKIKLNEKKLPSLISMRY